MVSKKRIIVFIADKIHDDGKKLLSRYFNVIPRYGLNNSELLQLISENKGSGNDTLIVRSTRKIDAEFIKQFSASSSVKVLCTVSSGFDNVDTLACKKYGVRFFNVPYGNYISAAEHTLALLLAITKRLKTEHDDILKGRFNSQSGKTIELFDKRIGIIGVGRVGSYVAKLSKSFGMKVIGNDIKKSVVKKYKWIEFVSLNKLLQICDIITVHTPLDKSTRNLINGQNIKLLSKSAILLNCARGGIVEERAIYNVFKIKKIYYAGIDVFENEPNIDFKFAKLDNVLLSPHLAGKTRESYKRMAVLAAQRLISYYK